MAVRGEHGRDLGQGRGGVVDDLEDAVAADEVDALALLGRQAVGVPLPSGDAVGDAEVGGAAFERGEGVGTGVDDDDVVTELGERDGQASRTATEVEDPQRAAEVGLTLPDQLAHGVPDALVADVGPRRRRGRGGTGTDVSGRSRRSSATSSVLSGVRSASWSTARQPHWSGSP